MNWSRGLFRLWVLFTVAWVAAVAWFAYLAHSSPYLPEKVYFVRSQSASLDGGPSAARLIDEDHKASKEYEGVYIAESYTAQMELRKLSKSFDFPNRVKLYVFEGDSQEVSSDFLTRFEAVFGDRSAELNAYRTKNLVESAAFMVWPPLAVLLIGSAMIWALRGFKRQ